MKISQVRIDNLVYCLLFPNKTNLNILFDNSVAILQMLVNWFSELTKYHFSGQYHENKIRTV